MMRERKKKYCFNCPECGKFNGRSALADSEQPCIRCGEPLVVQVRNGKVTVFKDRRKAER